MPKNRTLAAVAFAAVALSTPAAWGQAPSAPLPASEPASAPAGSVQAAQASVAAAAEPPTEAETTLDAAVKNVAALKSVSADIAQSVEMLDQKFEVRGRYLRAPDRRIYLRLKVAGLPDSDGETLQVCDGQTLWDYQQVLESKQFRRVQIGAVFEKLKSPELDAQLREQIIAQLGFAGPDQLLAGLRKSVKFNQKTEGTLDGRAVWVLRGEWINREGLLGPNQQPLPPTVSLPAYVPSLVVVTLGQDDGWPYKLRLVGRKPTALLDTRKVGPNGKRIGAQSSIQEVKPTVIELVYSNVKFNPDLKLDEFVFQAPPNATVEDNTQQITAKLDQQIQISAARRKAEAAKGGDAPKPEPAKADDALLKESIKVPLPGGAASAPRGKAD